MKKLIFIGIFLSINTIHTQQKQCIKTLDSISGNEIFDLVDLMPRPEKGMDILYKNIRDNIKVDSTVKAYTSIRASVAFVVCEDGNIIGKRILFDTTDFNLGEQLLDVATELQWIPGKCNETAVPVMFKIPIVICYR